MSSLPSSSGSSLDESRGINNEGISSRDDSSIGNDLGAYSSYVVEPSISNINEFCFPNGVTVGVYSGSSVELVTG